MWSARVYADEKYRTFLQMLGDSRVGRLNSWLLGMPVEQAIEEARRDPAAPAAMVWSVRLLGIAALIFPALILALAVFAAVR